MHGAVPPLSACLNGLMLIQAQGQLYGYHYHKVSFLNRDMQHVSNLSVRVDVLTALNMKTVFWVLKPCSSEGTRMFRSNILPSSSGSKNSPIKPAQLAACFCYFLALVTLRP
jgi:hypothetical protein